MRPHEDLAHVPKLGWYATRVKPISNRYQVSLRRSLAINLLAADDQNQNNLNPEFFEAVPLVKKQTLHRMEGIYIMANKQMSTLDLCGFNLQ